MDIKKLYYIPFLRITACSVCDHVLNKPLLSFPKFPLTEIYTSKKFTEEIALADLNFCLCPNCGHGQLTNIISPEILYGNSYHFRTSTSSTASRSNDFFLSFINNTLNQKKVKNVIEIGCSDLYLLHALKTKADKLIGIDPILKGKEQQLSDEKIKVHGDFIENINLNNYDFDQSIILSSHTLEHIQNPKAIIQNLLDRATPSTIFFFQFPCFDALLENCRFDQIFHQHLHYFSIYSISYLIEKLGGEIINSTINYQHWGSLLLAFKKQDRATGTIITKTLSKIIEKDVLTRYTLFQQRMDSTNKYLQSLKSPIVGYGAALMLPVLAYHLKTNFSGVEFIADDDKNKEGLFYINLQVPIKSTDAIKDPSSTTILITAIDNCRQIIPKALALNPKRIIIPFNNI